MLSNPNCCLHVMVAAIKTHYPNGSPTTRNAMSCSAATSSILSASCHEYNNASACYWQFAKQKKEYEPLPVQDTLLDHVCQTKTWNAANSAYSIVTCQQAEKTCCSCVPFQQTPCLPQRSLCRRISPMIQENFCISVLALPAFKFSDLAHQFFFRNQKQRGIRLQINCLAPFHSLQAPECMQSDWLVARLDI